MRVVRVLLGSLWVVAGMLPVVTFGMRTKSPMVLDAIRRMNRAYVNPRQHDAGEPVDQETS